MILLATLRLQLNEFKNIIDFGMLIILVGEIYVIGKILVLYISQIGRKTNQK